MRFLLTQQRSVNCCADGTFTATNQKCQIAQNMFVYVFDRIIWFSYEIANTSDCTRVARKLLEWLLRRLKYNLPSACAGHPKKKKFFEEHSGVKRRSALKLRVKLPNKPCRDLHLYKDEAAFRCLFTGLHRCLLYFEAAKESCGIKFCQQQKLPKSIYSAFILREETLAFTHHFSYFLPENRLRFGSFLDMWGTSKRHGFCSFVSFMSLSLQHTVYKRSHSTTAISTQMQSCGFTAQFPLILRLHLLFWFHFE